MEGDTLIFSFVLIFLLIASCIGGEPSKSLKQLETSDISYREFDRIFGLESKLTDLQKEEEWKKYKGKVVTWRGEIGEILEGTFSGFGVVFKHKRTTLTHDVLVSFNNSFRDKLMKFEKGDVVTYRGILTSRGGLLSPSLEGIDIGETLPPLPAKITTPTTTPPSISTPATQPPPTPIPTVRPTPPPPSTQPPTPLPTQTTPTTPTPGKNIIPYSTTTTGDGFEKDGNQSTSLFIQDAGSVSFILDKPYTLHTIRFYHQVDGNGVYFIKIDTNNDGNYDYTVADNVPGRGTCYGGSPSNCPDLWEWKTFEVQNITAYRIQYGTCCGGSVEVRLGEFEAYTS